MAKFLEIESIEWVENIPANVEATILITSESGSSIVSAGGSLSNLMKILNEYSKDGWEVVDFTDTFNYIGGTTLQRRKCYLLSRS